MKKITKSLAAVILVTLLAFQSCKKQEPVVTSLSKAEEFKIVSAKQMQANKASVDLMTWAMSELSTGSTKAMRLGSAYRVANCADMVVDSTVFPYTFVIDLSGGCTDDNGKQISGVITGSFSSEDLENSGDFIEFSTTGFNYDTFTLSGTVRVEVSSVSGNNTFGTFTSALTTNFKFSEMELSGVNNFTLEYVHDPINNDGNMFFSGTGSGTNNNGFSYTQTINSPLMAYIGDNCNINHFLQGILLIQASGLPDREIDYGNGSCDNIAHVTESGVRDRIFLD